MSWYGSKNVCTITACACALAIIANALRNSLGPPISIGSNCRPALEAAERRSSTNGGPNWLVVGVVARTAMRAEVWNEFAEQLYSFSSDLSIHC